MMNSFPELGLMLRTLRLSRMLDSLEVPNRQALQEHMVPIDSPHDDDLHENVAARYEKLPMVNTSS